MHLVIISGMSGSGKTQALHTLEDLGYYCIDNLPIELLDKALTTERLLSQKKIAICIDIRSGKKYLETLPEIMTHLKKRFKTDIIYLYAGKATLMKRYDETRRKHPLTKGHLSLRESILQEYELLAPVRAISDLNIDTSKTDIYELDSEIKVRVAGSNTQSLSLMFQSFGFKYGTPRDSDYLFDVRCLPNPYWIPELRSHSGLEDEVIDWLDSQVLVQKMKADITQFLESWIPYCIDCKRSYLTVSIGCTGGHHRSVYLTEALAKTFRQHYKKSIIINHRELKTN